jgi:hypothetical protein
VPTLNPHALLVEGMRTAREARVKARGESCIYKGLLGVMFTVR